jgi:tetratricopeptide (TPR) repeat protein
MTVTCYFLPSSVSPETLTYEPALGSFNRALDELKTQGVDEIDEHQCEKLILSLFGRRALRIPRQESDAANRLEDIYKRVLDEEKGSPPREKALRELLLASREFLADYPASIFASDAAFHEAWSTKELGRYEEAEELFERFLDTYPFSASVGGAQSWIDEIRHRLRLRNSGNAPERQLELAEYLMREEKSTEEAVTLAFEAYSRKLELLARMTLPVRFVLTGEYVFYQMLGTDLNATEALGDLLSKYRDDAAFRGQIRMAIEAKAPPERTQLLLQLLDSTSGDWKYKAPAHD